MSDMNFLVIDDDEVFSGILARGLTRRGYTVSEAHNADEAIKLANQQKFSQITVDLHLGNDSGLDARRALARFAARRAHAGADRLCEHRHRGAGGERRCR